MRDRRARAWIEARLARVRLGNLRVYFGFEPNMIVVLLGGGTKSSQYRDIATAHVYWHNYRSRDDG